MERVYLDYAATTPTHPDVIKAMLPYFHDIFGNPSSIYEQGQEARAAVEESRTKVAALMNAHPEEIVFTSGGTEADNFAIKGVVYANEAKGNHIITSAVEHHAVLETCHFLQKRGYKVTFLPVDKFGMVDPDEVRKAITTRTVLVSIMHANNEVGTIQPLAEIGQIVRDAGVYFHTDAVQTFGHLPVDVNTLGVDLLSLSGHKLYGPKGVGALYIRKGTRMVSFMHGGEQERRRRAGTENVPGIVGLGCASEMARGEMEDEAIHLTHLRDRLITGLTEGTEHLHLNGHPVKRLPNNVNLNVAFVEGEAICLNLDLAGICSSTGSACSSASLEPSHVLMAMGSRPEDAHGLLRLTLGKWTTETHIDYVLETLPAIIAKLRAMSPLWKGAHK